jgi:hypothetical protein
MAAIHSSPTAAGPNIRDTGTLPLPAGGHASTPGPCAVTESRGREVSFHSNTAWVNNQDPEYDFGAIKLDCTVGVATGTYGFFWQAAPLTDLDSQV